jgi:hypothetical protein
MLVKEVVMSVRTLVAVTVLATALIVTPTLARTAKPPVQASRITFAQVTRVCGHYLSGTYVVVHDDTKMARGEPCTTFYRLNSDTDAEAVVSFHCLPRQRDVVSSTTITTTPTPGTTTATRTVDLVEYQIAGDSEAHGVPAYDSHVTTR